MKKKTEEVIKYPPGESGAPAALKAIEAHELACRKEKDLAHSAWKRAQELEVEGDDVSERKERLTHTRYVESLEHWDDATKKLAIFDKGVKEERREGEKILVSEVKEIFAQFDLSINLAVEQYIIAQAQSAALCGSPEEFHLAHADNIRAAKAGAIDAAKREGVLPNWIL
jgi:hypothetical protein